jgi:antitoxin component YwqK of YwqJK toxin-antitoxin module
MGRDNILDYEEVMDESQILRRRVHPKDGSGWVPNGRYIVLRETGQLHIQLTYREGILHGPYLDYWLNGKVSCEGQHSEGEQDGIWHFYKVDGAISAIIQFKDGKVIDDAQYNYDAEGNLIDVVHASDFKVPKKDCSPS